MFQLQLVTSFTLPLRPVLATIFKRLPTSDSGFVFFDLFTCVCSICDGQCRAFYHYLVATTPILFLACDFFTIVAYL